MSGRVTFSDLSGGRNAIDPIGSPDLQPTHCRDAVNVDWWQSKFAHKRRGLTPAIVAFSAGGPFTGKVSFVGRHTPSVTESNAELWAVDAAATPVVGRRTAQASFTAPTLKDAISGNAWEVMGASIDGRYLLAYQSAVNRLHVWDGSTVRRAGIDPGASAPTAANSGGGGAYPATLQYFRARFYNQPAGVTAYSEPTPSVSFTPSGANASVTITRPTAPNEGETAWVAEASLDNVTFYQLSAIAIATTTYVNTTPPASYAATFNASYATGTFTLQKPYKFIASDNGRLLGFGSYNTSDRQDDLEISAVVGSLDRGDVERVDTTQIYKYNLDEHDSGEPTGLCGPGPGGAFYAFKTREMCELRPTGDVSHPYAITWISKVLGAVRGKAYCIGEDAQGNACVYVMTAHGLYRYGVGGLVYVGKGIEDYTVGPTASLYLDASVVCHMLYHDDKKQLWIWWATTTAINVAGSSFPDTAAIYHVQTGGCSRLTGAKIAKVRAAVSYSYSTQGLFAARQRRPYLGSDNAVNTIYQADDEFATDDDTTAFQSYVTTQPIEPSGPGINSRTHDAILSAKVATGVTITVTATPDYHTGESAFEKTGTLLLTADSSETDVTKRMAETAIHGAQAVQYQVGDGAAAAVRWTLHRLTTVAVAEEPIA